MDLAMDMANFVDKTSYNYTTDNIEIRNLNTVKARNDAGEANKPARHNSKDNYNINKVTSSNEYQPIPAGSGDSVINKIELQQYIEEATKDRFNKIFNTQKSCLKLRKPIVNIIREATPAHIIKSIEKIVKQNIYLQNTFPTFDAKSENKITKTVSTKADRREPEDRDGRYKDNNTLLSSYKNVNEDKVTKEQNRKDKKNSKLALVVKIPKTASSSKIQKNESLKSKNVAGIDISIDTVSRHGPEKPITLNKYAKKTHKESNSVSSKHNNDQHGTYPTLPWSRNPDSLYQSSSTSHENMLAPYTPPEDVHKKTIKGKNSKKKDSSHLGFRKEKLPLKRFKQKSRETTCSSPGESRSTSPPTEVAKWASTAADKHTKLYYEAWVNTSLGVLSKGGAELPKESQKTMKFCQKYGNMNDHTRHACPYTDYKDKRFIGTIKIKHTKKVKNY